MGDLPCTGQNLKHNETGKNIIMLHFGMYSNFQFIFVDHCFAFGCRTVGRIHCDINILE